MVTRRSGLRPQAAPRVAVLELYYWLEFIEAVRTSNNYSLEFTKAVRALNNYSLEFIEAVRALKLA